jgi:arsenate reductase
MLFVNYPKCSTCQKARKWLEEKGFSFESRDIREEPPTLQELTEWYEKSGLPLKKFFNTSGMLYKSMGLKDKLPDMTEEEQLRLLSSDGMLVRRPVLINEAVVLVGFKEKEWAEKLK